MEKHHVVEMEMPISGSEGKERNSVWPLQIAGKVTQLFRAARGGREL